MDCFLHLDLTGTLRWQTNQCDQQRRRAAPHCSESWGEDRFHRGYWRTRKNMLLFQFAAWLPNSWMVTVKTPFSE